MSLDLIRNSFFEEKKFSSPRKDKEYVLRTVSLPEYFSVALSLLHLLEKSLGRSKPATRLMQAH